MLAEEYAEEEDSDDDDGEYDDDDGDADGGRFEDEEEEGDGTDGEGGGGGGGERKGACHGAASDGSCGGNPHSAGNHHLFERDFDLFLGRKGKGDEAADLHGAAREFAETGNVDREWWCSW